MQQDSAVNIGMIEIETKILPEWLYARGQLSFESESPAVKTLIDSFMNVISTKATDPNTMFNILANMIGISANMYGTDENLTEQQISECRMASVRSVAETLPDVFSFHEANMPLAIKVIEDELKIADSMGEPASTMPS